MKVGRNDNCPCGSGKKYKKCCLPKAAEPSQTLYYRRLSEAHDRLVDRLFNYVDKHLGNDAVGLAMEEFLGWPESDDETTEAMLEGINPLFWPWFLFNWEYDSTEAEDVGVKLDIPDGTTIIEMYAHDHGGKLDPLEHMICESVNGKPYSFWEVVDVNPGKTMMMEDMLLGAQVLVQERSASNYVQTGDIVFGRAVLIDRVGMLFGLSQAIIPSDQKPEIVQLKELFLANQTKLTDQDLYDWDVEIRELYFSIGHAHHNPPQINNTDGDTMEFHQLIYELDSADEAFKILSELCEGLTFEELTSQARYDATGQLEHAKFSWNRLDHGINSGLPPTVLGHLTIDNNRLTVEVNSAKRAELIRKEIETRLGERARFIVDDIQDIEAMMSRQADDYTDDDPFEQIQLMQNPEIQAQLADMVSSHWERWVDQPIPALAGKSPREAVKEPDGLKAVEALLYEAGLEGNSDMFTVEMNRLGTQRVREILGLKSPK